MNPAQWAYATTAAALAFASGCTGWGDTPDPGTPPSTPSVSAILQLPNGATLDHVGHVAVEGGTIYAVATASGGNDGIPVRMILRKASNESWTTVWKSSSSTYSVSNSQAEPRILVKEGAVYWTESASNTVTIRTWSPGDEQPRTACSSTTMGDVPAAIAALGNTIFALTSSGQCAYGFGSSSTQSCLVPGNDAALASCLVNQTVVGDAGVDGGVTPRLTEVFSGRPLIANGMINAMVAEGSSLYWFEGASHTGQYEGASLVKLTLGVPSDAGPVQSEPTTAATLDAASYPFGFAFEQGDIYVATSRQVDSNSAEVTGCAIMKLAKNASAFTMVMSDDSRTCRGLSADSTQVWFATTWIDGEDNIYREGVARFLPSSQSQFPTPLRVERDGITLLETVMNGDNLLVVSRGGLLQAPKALVP
jgi:hypothetical protein